MLGVLAYIIAFHNTKQFQQKEGFVELSKKDTEYIRKERGIEKCDALLFNGDHLSEQERLTMTHYIEGLRLRKWKPSENDPMFQILSSNNDIQYCYLYDDKENATQDYILKEEEGQPKICNKENDIFKNPMINTVFESEFQDKTHNIPIKKCIFGIDRSQAHNNNVKNFWSTWTVQNCHRIAQTLRDELRNLEREHDRLIGLVNEKNDKVTNQVTEQTLKDVALKTCVDFNLNSDLLIDEVKSDLESYELQNESLIGVLSTLEAKIKRI
jgi:effector-binding domain-containing protein